MVMQPRSCLWGFVSRPSCALMNGLGGRRIAGVFCFAFIIIQHVDFSLPLIFYHLSYQSQLYRAAGAEAFMGKTSVASCIYYSILIMCPADVTAAVQLFMGLCLLKKMLSLMERNK